MTEDEKVFESWGKEDLRLLESTHLSPELREVVQPFYILAKMVASRTPAWTRQKCLALDHLLWSKDAAVRDVVLQTEQADQKRTSGGES